MELEHGHGAEESWLKKNAESVLHWPPKGWFQANRIVRRSTRHPVASALTAAVASTPLAGRRPLLYAVGAEWFWVVFSDEWSGNCAVCAKETPLPTNGGVEVCRTDGKFQAPLPACSAGSPACRRGLRWTYRLSVSSVGAGGPGKEWL